MTEQTIKVEGLPEGWKLTRIKLPDSRTAHINSSTISCHNFTGALFDLEKIQPRRIVLEEITKEEYYRIFHDEPFAKIYDMRESYWQKVKETDIPLTNAEPKLSLNVAECKSIIYAPIELHVKLEKFIKENS